MKSGFERIGYTVTVEQAHRSCLDKKRYTNRNNARDAAARNVRRFPDSKRQRPYACTLCHGFHLTSQVPAGLKQGKGTANAGPRRKAA